MVALVALAFGALFFAIVGRVETRRRKAAGMEFIAGDARNATAVRRTGEMHARICGAREQTREHTFPCVDACTQVCALAPTSSERRRGLLRHMMATSHRAPSVRLSVRRSVGRSVGRLVVHSFVRSFVRWDSAAPHRLESPTFRGHGSRALSRRSRRGDYVAARSTGAARYELKDAPFPRARACTCASAGATMNSGR